MLTSPDTCGSTLAVIVIDHYDSEGFSWEPEVLRAELQDDFNVELHPLVVDKLGAVGTVLTSDAPLRDVVAFNMVCEAMSSDPVEEGVFDMADPDQMVVGLLEIVFMLGTEVLQEFSEDVRRYMGFVLSRNGFSTVPEVLAIAIMPSNTEAAIKDLASSAPELAAAKHSMQQGVLDDMYLAARAYSGRLEGQLAALGVDLS